MTNATVVPALPYFPKEDPLAEDLSMGCLSYMDVRAVARLLFECTEGKSFISYRSFCSLAVELAWESKDSDIVETFQGYRKVEQYELINGALHELFKNGYVQMCLDRAPGRSEKRSRRWFLYFDLPDRLLPLFID